MSTSKITFNEHGKGRVRMVKLRRLTNGTHEVMQMNVQILLQGKCMDDAFTAGNNKNVIPTDTCKNTVYYIGRTNNFDSIEEFGLLLVKHFLNAYPKIVNRVEVEISRDRWERVAAPDSNGRMADHKHAFTRNNNAKPFCKVQGACAGNGVNNNTGRASGPVVITAQGGFKNLDIMKSTQSGFVDFHQCPNTSLKPDTNRFVGTSCDAEWSYDPRILSRKNDFNAIARTIETVMIRKFCGPSDTGVYSASVQQTLFDMGTAALNAAPTVEKILLYAPNLHVIAYPLEEKVGVPNKDHTGKPDVFFPIDEPYGMIRCMVERTRGARL